MTSRSSVLETALSLCSLGLNVNEAVVLVDRQQGGRETLAKHSITLRSVCDCSQLLENLLDAGRISSKIGDRVLKFIADHKVGMTHVSYKVSSS